MALDIATFSNQSGPSALFKALGHPLAADQAADLLARLAAAGPLAIYDPLGELRSFAALHDLSGLTIAGYFVQRIEELGRDFAGHAAAPVTALADCPARAILIAAFDAPPLAAHIDHLIPREWPRFSLDALRLPDAMLANPRRYLDGLNFATNFAFFRDDGDGLFGADGNHTRVVTANYWGTYGADDASLWLRLMGEDGATLAEWTEPLPPAGAAVTIDSRDVRKRFGLPPFVGQLFIHVLRPKGHEVVKYALDTYGDRRERLSCTHDANAWPADYYAGLPAPDDGERVILWLQNSHPCAIPAGGIGLAAMGRDPVRTIGRSIAPFATLALDVAELLPDLRWPDQIEIHAGRHVVRPRYEVEARGRRRIAHVNVERSDLQPDPGLAAAAQHVGKGFILPAPVLPPELYRTWILPTPMARSQEALPVRLAVYDPQGRTVLQHRPGRLPRDAVPGFDLDLLLKEAGSSLAQGWGHVEVTYDLDQEAAGAPQADGWLHALFRYEDRRSGHGAETSFGAHIFNTAVTWRNEPQSYLGRPPGLSTRLFLRLGPPPLDTFCMLIYAASTPWHGLSDTTLVLHDAAGRALAERPVEIPCSGSLLWRASQMFSGDELVRAAGGYVLVRDRTCRLFGYHGLLGGEDAFSLDHMFGF
ncbi:MAG: hypothetical protein RLQ25_05420 [Alphaproteobacteria bacterium]